MPIEARNNFVFIKRNESETETESGLLIPDKGQEKTHYGEIVSVGDLVQDKKIKEDKFCMFHKGNGFEIEYETETYLVIEGERIIAGM